jgi:uncharacterized membrane protein (DUF2068 family)
MCACPTAVPAHAITSVSSAAGLHESISFHHRLSRSRNANYGPCIIEELPAPSRTKSKPKPKLKKSTSVALVLIGAYKLLEAVALFVAGIGLLRYLHRDISTPILHWIHVLRIDPDNRYIHRVLAKVFSVSPKQLRELSVGSFVYSGLRLVEGAGLVMRKRWAEYFVVIVTAIFIPLEAYELFHRFTAIRLGLLLANAAIVWYLARNLRRH